MKKIAIFFGIGLMLCLRIAGVSAAETAQNLGEILFFPQRANRPAQDRHLVAAGQVVSLCLKFSPEKVDFLEEVRRKAVSFELTLEDAAVPPNEITIDIGDGETVLRQDRQGCYATRFTVPQATAPGVYQVADLLARFSDGTYFSLRDYLFGFSKVEELDVQNRRPDTEGPELLGIHSLDAPLKPIAGVKKLRIKVKQDFYFRDEGTSVDPSTLKIFYRLWEDDQTAGYVIPVCKVSGKKSQRFRCQLKVARPKPIWNLRELKLELAGIYLKDREGNVSAWEDEKFFEEKSCGPVEFRFVDRESWKKSVLKKPTKRLSS